LADSSDITAKGRGRERIPKDKKEVEGDDKDESWKPLGRTRRKKRISLCGE
jgi:hypothetical protein